MREGRVDHLQLLYSALGATWSLADHWMSRSSHPTTRASVGNLMRVDLRESLRKRSKKRRGVSSTLASLPSGVGDSVVGSLETSGDGAPTSYLPNLTVIGQGPGPISPSVLCRQVRCDNRNCGAPDGRKESHPRSVSLIMVPVAGDAYCPLLNRMRDTSPSPISAVHRMFHSLYTLKTKTIRFNDEGI